MAFTHLRFPFPGSQRGSQEPLVAGEYALHLPALSIDLLGELFLESSTIPALWPLASAIGIAFHGDDALFDAELLPRQDVVVLSIVALVAKQFLEFHESACFS